MDQQGFVKLAIVGFALVIASFFVRGFSSIVLPGDTAQLLSAPVLLLGFFCFVYLFVRATLSVVGIWPIERSETP